MTGEPSGGSKIPRKGVSGRGARLKTPSEKGPPVGRAVKANSLGAIQPVGWPSPARTSLEVATGMLSGGFKTPRRLLSGWAA